MCLMCCVCRDAVYLHVPTLTFFLCFFYYLILFVVGNKAIEDVDGLVSQIRRIFCRDVDTSDADPEQARQQTIKSLEPDIKDAQNANPASSDTEQTANQSSQDKNQDDVIKEEVLDKDLDEKVLDKDLDEEVLDKDLDEGKDKCKA